eukprot:CAMPEP_0113640084 /NCGR_PEP_ID=MMETSP0017_2-20120614/21034_1 /TAXON_ID=2856 /ORGANISM="Cylindrotheca closterium" /LENGTH=511 /DNA_ID=CAMNT_0000551341 /DNA_START=164 /DNA_END=1696 /DNA_ORIENTATION=- /assembly_acc=CAM_ASM_000147
MRTLLHILLLFLSLCISPVTSRRPEPRIVGGTNARQNEFPYFVQMGMCGGALIAPGIVLSAAHCNTIFEIGVYVTINPHGVKDLSSRRVKIVERIFHPWYWEEWASYDFILVRLEEPVFPSPKLVLNQDRSFPPDNTTLTAMGFGSLKSGSNRFPEILQKVDLESVNLEDCNKTLEGNLLDDSFLCAGTVEGGKDSCQGDSGGPLVAIQGNKHILAGLVSWGEGCGDAGMPGAYARVSSAMDWIKKVVCDCWSVEGASFCSESIAEKRSSLNNTAGTNNETKDEEEEEWSFDCPLRIDPNCQDTPGYVDYVGDVCSWHEEVENPGCVDFGESPGGMGFEDTNALSECCWCGGGSIQPSTPPPMDFVKDPECVDLEGWTDQHRDDCSWYETHTEAGSCSGWGTIRGGYGFRDVTPDLACCHCGGGNFPTPAPSPMPSMVPSQSFAPSTPLPTENPTENPTTTPPDDSQAPELDDPNSANTNSTGDSSAAATNCWNMGNMLVVSLGMLLLVHV